MSETNDGLSPIVTGGEYEPLGWLPIETAPKDGTPILAAVIGIHTPMEIEADGVMWTWAHGTNTLRSFDCFATHWQPLPEPPK